MGTKEIKEVITIAPLNRQTAVFKVSGENLVMHKFSQKTIRQLMDGMEQGDKKKSKKKREPRDFKQDYENATHKFPDGKPGIPATAFRKAMIAACRTAGYVMTRAKQSILYIEADGHDEESTPLIRIKGKREMLTGYVRNQTGVVDVRARPIWKSWSCEVRVVYDADMLEARDIANLLMRAGAQVGILEGRPASKNSDGMGWGTFEIEEKAA